MLIAPSKLSLFSRSPVIGAWWEELEARWLFNGSKSEVSSLDRQLFTDGSRHAQVLLQPTGGAGALPCSSTGSTAMGDYAATKGSMFLIPWPDRWPRQHGGSRLSRSTGSAA